MKTHRLTFSDKVKFLEKDAHDREEFKKALEEKVKKLETELANAHLSFKKFDAGSQKIDEIWNAQKTLLTRPELDTQRRQPHLPNRQRSLILRRLKVSLPYQVRLSMLRLCHHATIVE